MAISFDQIPVSILVPGQYIEISNTGAVQGLFGMPSRILVLGQKLAGGAAATGVPVIVADATQAEAYFGRGSMLHRMFLALKAGNNVTETWAIPLADDAGGAAASGNILFGGTITGAGTLSLYIGGRQVRVAVAASATPAQVATAAATAINADTLLPVTAAVNGLEPKQVDITARHKGENGNGIDIRVNYYAGEMTPPGLTTTITALIGGSGNPDVADAIAAMGDTWWTDVICPWTDGSNLAALETEAAARNGPLVMQDFAIYGAVRGTYAGLTTWASSRNSEHTFVLGADAPPGTPEEWAASYGGIAAYYSHIDPARPLQTLVLPGIKPPATADRFTWAERNVLLGAGVGTFRVDDGGLVRIERAVSAYVTNPYGVADPSWRDLETKKTVAWIRYQRRPRVATKFPRHKLANDGTSAGAGQALVTPKIIRADGIAQFRQWEEVGMVESVDSWIGDYIVERDATDPNRVNELLPADIVNGLRVFAGRVQFRL